MRLGLVLGLVATVAAFFLARPNLPIATAFPETPTPTASPVVHRPWGDIDCVFYLSAADAVQVLQYVASNDAYPGADNCPEIGSGTRIADAGDVNCDGSITPLDSLFIIRYAATLEMHVFDPDCPPTGAPVVY